MRGLKFRAWDKKQKQMWWYGSPSINGDMSGFSCSEIDSTAEEYPYDSEGILMQYTGLKDKNGKEIYEGDIIHIDGYYFKHLCIYRQEFCDFVAADIRYPDPEGCFGGWSINSGKHGTNKQMSVVGNIYENPELLGKES